MLCGLKIEISQNRFSGHHEKNLVSSFPWINNDCHMVEILELRIRMVNSLHKLVAKPDSPVFFHIQKWASNPVLRRTFQLQSALENFLYIGNTCYKYVKVSLNVFLYDKKRIGVMGVFKKNLHTKQKCSDSKKCSLCTIVRKFNSNFENRENASKSTCMIF